MFIFLYVYSENWLEFRSIFQKVTLPPSPHNPSPRPRFKTRSESALEVSLLFQSQFNSMRTTHTDKIKQIKLAFNILFSPIMNLR